MQRLIGDAMKQIVIFAVIFLGCIDCLAQQPLTKDEAVSKAETAIVRNGCTDLSPLKKRSKLSFGTHKPPFVLKHSLDCRAIAVVPMNKISGFAWMVVFWLEHWCPECTGDRERAILLSRDGSKMRLVKQISKIPIAWKSG